VPSSAKNAAQPTDTAMAFEEALKKLESVVEAMESGDLPLESLLSRFEEGIRLVRVCQVKLEEAELKIERLEKQAGSDLTLKPLTDPAES
jgi:exodeoxyribonuclease VII small subunit